MHSLDFCTTIHWSLVYKMFKNYFELSDFLLYGQDEKQIRIYLVTRPVNPGPFWMQVRTKAVTEEEVRLGCGQLFGFFAIVFGQHFLDLSNGKSRIQTLKKMTL